MPMAQKSKYQPPFSVGESIVWLGGCAGLGYPSVFIDHGTYHGTVAWIGRIPEIGPSWTAGIEFVSYYLIKDPTRSKSIQIFCLLHYDFKVCFYYYSS